MLMHNFSHILMKIACELLDMQKIDTALLCFRNDTIITGHEPCLKHGGLINFLSVKEFHEFVSHWQ